MSEPEQYTEDIDEHARTPEQQEVADINMDDPTATDDVPWTPPEQRPIGAEFADQEQDPTQSETIEQRLAQEVPDVGEESASSAEESLRDAISELDDEAVGNAEGVEFTEPEQ